MIMFVMPIVMLFLLGYAATNDVRNVPDRAFSIKIAPLPRAS